MKILVAGWDSGGAWKPCRRWCGGRCGHHVRVLGTEWARRRIDTRGT
jgi:hypothetical protein